MQRVLVTILTSVFGGPHNQVVQLNGALKQRGWELTVAMNAEPGSGHDRLKEAGVRVIPVELVRPRRSVNPMLHARYVRNLRRDVGSLSSIIEAERIDIIQSCGLMNIQTALAARRTGRPLVWQLLGLWPPPFVRRALSIAVKRYAAVVMTAGSVVAGAHHGISDLGNRLVVFYPPPAPAPLGDSGALRNAARELLGFPRDSIVIGTVGNLNKTKRHELLLQAVFRMPRPHGSPAVAVCIIGATTPSHARYYDSVVRPLIAELEAAGILVILRETIGIPALLPAFDIFALSSRAEGVPTVVLEAMQAELPVVAVAVGGVGEVVIPGRTGFITSDHVDDFSAALQVLVTDRDLRRKFGTAGKSRVAESFSTAQTIERHVDAYERALASSRRRQQ